MQKLMVAALLFLPLTPALAVDCDNASSQSEMNQCASEEYKKADDELNSVYKQTLKSTSGKQKTLLQQAQKKWISYRDADCHFQTFKSMGGSLWSMNVSGCLRDKTRQRTSELKNMLNCPEGDVSCPL
ncbi:hypothetical protein BL250_02045 [Erwinia sp. OLTSP20]|uniref:lysozyme inhibitor LprI family protein n=1 Tax=unclassified Erwinia TaxID=2622719 RepID=UPI000C18D422|nr:MULTISPECIES: lysozyme inhibitor LprI family protein [unclassified Erwinia]PIJ52049.1 hypothetical protein BV501_01280 [Erwinia sp. OAMSP11]PIJ75212.1 hypothetical protein BK416_02200 [Erwinia sp. OLSSP12]PIJ84419.1 hypothetical protein BLD47_02095 [Erwinia sp. OLCASP19]PIJ87033.1 hypothetical protein BLD46_01680 [Erwinia sp. OLMTSP26]PIJ88596.1 hypothetical protein BLD49_01260 [Erwinia sp. OLMDSP33]